VRKGLVNRVLVVLTLWCMWVVAFAGHYSVTYYGGTVYMVGPMNRPWVRTYGLASDGWYGGQGQSQDEPIGGLAPMPGIGWVDCSGPVTAHFTWIPDFQGDEPPPCAVLTEEGQASWSGNTGTCTDGLGHPPVGSVSQGTKYAVLDDPGESFDITNSGHARGDCTDPETGPLSASASVRYRAAVTPVRIVVSGTTPHLGHDSCLIGQGLSATVDAGGLSVVNHHWAVSGATFRKVDYGASHGSWIEYRRIIDLSAWDLSQPQLKWFFEEPDSYQETISCSFTLKAGNVVIGDAGASKQVDVWFPESTISADTTSVKYSPSNTGPTELKCGDASTDPGITFLAQVRTPTFFGPGEWSFAQTCDLFRNQSGPFGWRGTDTDGFVLDTSWPYTGPYPAPQRRLVLLRLHGR